MGKPEVPSSTGLKDKSGAHTARPKAGAPDLSRLPKTNTTAVGANDAMELLTVVEEEKIL